MVPSATFLPPPVEPEFPPQLLSPAPTPPPVATLLPALENAGPWPEQVELAAPVEEVEVVPVRQRSDKQVVPELG